MYRYTHIIILHILGETVTRIRRSLLDRRLPTEQKKVNKTHQKNGSMTVDYCVLGNKLPFFNEMKSVDERIAGRASISSEVIIGYSILYSILYNSILYIYIVIIRNYRKYR